MAPGASSLKLTWRTVKPSTPAAWPSLSRTSSVSEPPSSVWRMRGGNLLEAGADQPLPRLDRLDEGGRLQQRLVRAGVEPGHAAPELLDVQPARAQIRGVDVGDLELAARRGHQPVRHLDHARVVEV